MADMLTNLFKPFFGWDIAATYIKAGNFIDFVVYLIFFFYIMKYVIAKRFEGETAKKLSMVLAVIFAIGMSVFSYTWGFKIGDMMPLAGLIFFGTIGIMIYKIFTGFGRGKPSSGAIAFVITYILLKTIVPGFFESIEGFGNGTIGSVMSFILWISVLTGLLGLGHGIGSAVKGSKGGSVLWGAAKGAGRLMTNKGREWLGKIQDSIAKRKEDIDDMDAKLKKLEDDISKVEDKDTLYLDGEAFNKKKEIDQIKYINQELKAMDELDEKFKVLDNQYDAIAAENKFKQFDPRIQEIDKRIDDIFNMYNDYKKGHRERLEWLLGQIRLRENKKLIEDSDKIIIELKGEITSLDKEHKDLVRVYKAYRELVLYGEEKSNITEKEKNMYAKLMEEIAEKLKEVVRAKKEAEGVLEEEIIGLKVREEMKKLGREEKRLVQSLIELTESFSKNIAERQYLRKKKKSFKEEKKLEELKEEYMGYKSLFKNKLTKLYDVNVKDAGLHNKIHKIHEMIKVLQKREKSDTLEAKQAFQKVFPGK